MIWNVPTLTRRFERVFNKAQANVLAESITEVYSDLVKTGDFNELKEIVRELAVSQQRTEARVEELAVAQKELTVAQQRTEARVEELAVAQKELTVAQQRTEARVEELASSQQEMAVSINEMAQAITGLRSEMTQAITGLRGEMTQAITGLRSEMGGLSRTMSYALENEAFRVLPAYLQKKFDIAVQSRFVRTEIGGEELDFYAQGEQDGRPVCIIGESKLRIDERRSGGQEFDRIMSQLNRKAAVVKQAYPDCGIVRMLVTHYVRPSARKLLEEDGVIVVQSFDWG
jgi:hypothetical protein